MCTHMTVLLCFELNVSVNVFISYMNLFVKITLKMSSVDQTTVKFIVSSIDRNNCSTPSMFLDHF